MDKIFREVQKRPEDPPDYILVVIWIPVGIQGLFKQFFTVGRQNQFQYFCSQFHNNAQNVKPCRRTALSEDPLVSLFIGRVLSYGVFYSHAFRKGGRGSPGSENR